MTLHRQATTNKASGRVGKPTGCSRAEPEEVSALRASPPRAAFTPGPWGVGSAPVTGQLCVQTEDPVGAWICGQLHNPEGNMALDEAVANARLIAAAPDYDTFAVCALPQLEVLHSTLPQGEARALVWRTILKGRAALAKARGDA